MGKILFASLLCKRCIFVREGEYCPLINANSRSGKKPAPLFHPIFIREHRRYSRATLSYGRPSNDP